MYALWEYILEFCLSKCIVFLGRILCLTKILCFRSLMLGMAPLTLGL